MSRKIKNEQKKFLGETLNQYDKALDESINQLDKKNREQNHKISSLVNSFDNEFLEKDVEGNITTLENSKDGMVIINEIQGSTEVNYCKDGEKELILNGDIDTQGESFVTITEGVDNGLVDVSLEGNTEINLSKTKDPVLVTREFDDINCNVGKLQYTIDDVTTINDEPGKVDIDRIVGDTMVNHAVNGSEELILNAHINESGDNNITLNGVTSDGGKVDVALEGNTLVNVSKTKDDYITPSIEDKVDKGSVISLPEVSEGCINIDSIEGNTLVNYCTDGAKELTLNGDIDVEGTFVTTTEGVDNGKVDVLCEGNTLVNLNNANRYAITKAINDTNLVITSDINYLKATTNGEVYNNDNWIYVNFGKPKLSLLKPNTKYTVIGDIIKGIRTMAICEGSTANAFTPFSSVKNNRVLLTTYNLIPEINNQILYGWVRDNKEDISIDIEVKNLIILEGDWTDKEIPQYFEGMKSVGQDDENGHKIEILSKTANEFPHISNPMSNNVSIISEGEYYCENPWGNVGRIKIKPRTKYTFSFKIKATENFSVSEGSGILRLDLSNGAIVTNSYNVTNLTTEYVQYSSTIACSRDDGLVTLNMRCGSNNGIGIYIKDVMLAEGENIPYIPYKLTKKEILLNEPLKSLPNGTKDKFVKIGGKWFVERNCKKIIFDGSSDEGWYSRIIEPSGKHSYQIDNAIDGYAEYRPDGISDKLTFINWNDSPWNYKNNCVSAFYNSVFIYTDFTTLAELKTWLQSNPITLIYELPTPIYEPLEIEPTLNTYNDTTHLSNNSIIPCNMQIKNSGYNAIIKPSTLYTVALDTNENGTIGINLAGAEVTITNNVATVTTPNTLTDDNLRLYGKGIKASKVRLLEGDKTNWIPSFFEGMKSSFEDKVQTDGSYKMEILSNNKNLFDVSNISIVGGNDAVGCHTLELGVNNGIKLTSVQDHQGWVYSILKLSNLLKPNTTYTFRCNITKSNPNSQPVLRIFRTLDNSDYGIIRESGSITFKTPTVGVEQLRLLVYSSINDIPTNQGDVTYFEDIQISEVASEYTPNKSNKIQFSSIEPLRGVNEIHDRLVFKDGKLMIERNCRQVAVQNSDIDKLTLASNFDSDTYLVFWLDILLGRTKGDRYSVKSNKFATRWFLDNIAVCEGMFGEELEDYSDRLYISIDKKRLTSLDGQGVMKWLVDNEFCVTYTLAEPTYEEIPYELQKIILESYANGTLFFNTNIPPTKVSFNCFEEELTYLYPATSYTVQFISDKAITADITLGGTSLLAQSIVKGLNRISITTPTELVDNKLIINGVGAKISEVVVTDTDRKFGYFEGMKSVGECEGNKIEILSHNNGNLIKGTAFTNGYYINRSTGETIVNEDFSYTDYIKVISNNIIHVYNTNLHYAFYDENKKYIGRVYPIMGSDYLVGSDSEFSLLVPRNAKYVKFSVPIKNQEVALASYTKNRDLNKSSIKSNIQQLNHEPLRAVGDYRDRYVIIDGKWYIERNTVVEVIGKQPNFGVVKTMENVTRISLSTKNQYKPSSILLNINFKSDRSDADYEHIRMDGTAPYSTAIQLYINNSKIGDITRDNVATYLTNNPFTIIGIAYQPTYEEIDYNPLETYADTTHITTNSAIPCNVTVKNHGYNLVALKENTQYTLYVNKNTTNALTYRLGDYVEINSLSKFTFTTPSTLTDKTLRIDGKGAKVNDLMLIEGTPTNDSIGYFDGLKSSYECEQVTDENDENYGKYKVDVKVVGKNLFDGELEQGTGKGSFFTGIHYTQYQNDNETRCRSKNLIEVVPNTQYTASYSDKGFQIAYWEIDKNGIVTKDSGWMGYNIGKITFNTKPTTRYLKFVFEKNGLTITPSDVSMNIQLEEGDTATEYEPYFESKQTIYLNSPLLKGDEIVWKDNKIQHYHKMKAVVFDGSDDEEWRRHPELDNDTTERYWIEKINNNQLLDVKINTISYNDKFDNIAKNNTCLYTHPTIARVDLRRLKTDNRWIDLNSLKQWLQQNPVTVVYELNTPYYEEISDYPLKLNVIANSSLSTESTIQVTNISFNIYEETLPYLYPNTKYYITFNADVDRNNIIIDLGGSHVVFDCKVGFNKVEITTPSDTTNLLTFSGTGVNIDHVKVTQQDIDEYFEGMKSVGECEELEIISANSDNSLSNAQQLAHEPLRGVEEVRDRYAIIDRKWYIERKYKEVVLDGRENWNCNEGDLVGNRPNTRQFFTNKFDDVLNNNSILSEKYKAFNTHYYDEVCISIFEKQTYKLRISDKFFTVEDFVNYLRQNPVTIIYRLSQPIYEPLDYNPFEVYSDTTHITANSLIPTNVVVKNHGYNCILKPSTKYTIALNKPNGTISAKLGGSAKVDSTNSIFTITTPSTLNDNVLRLSGSGKVKDIMILEGDKTVNTPSYFEGIESVFEQEYDTEKGKYRVTTRVEGNGKESSITFYLNEPLRGTGTAKDKVFIQDGKVVVERNCGSVTFDGSEEGWEDNNDIDSLNNIRI